MSNVVIDLFKKGDGLCCLKEIYNLSDSQITRIEDRVFEYATPPMPINEINEQITSLQSCFKNSTTFEARPEAYATIKKDVIISADRLSIEVI